MSPQIILVHDTDPGQPDAGWAADLRRNLTAELQARNLALTPDVETAAGFANVPDVTRLDPLSVVVVVLPRSGRGLTPDEADRLRDFLERCADGDERLFPLALDPARNVPPAPLDRIVAYKSPMPLPPAEVARLASFLLIQAGLRQSAGQKAVFISYRMKDGEQEAKHLAEQLRGRGYRVWRDELRDRDDLPLIDPGTEAQRTIHRAILDHGFVLVVDTPLAPHSAWVQEEVDTAYAHLLPILPVVVEDPVGGPAAVPAAGGRFGTVQRLLQGDVRLPLADRQRAGSAAAAMDPAWLDGLERAMAATLLAHARSRLRLVREAKARFEALQYDWRPLSPAHQLFEAVRRKHGPRSPHLAIRLLVQCVPYATLQDDLIENLTAHVARSPDPCQFGLLLHQVPTNAHDAAKLLRRSRGHLLAVTTADIADLPQLLSL